MKKKFQILLVLFFGLFLIGCNTPSDNNDNNNDNNDINNGITLNDYEVNFVLNNGKDDYLMLFQENSKIEIDINLFNNGYEFSGWYLDEDLTIPLTDDYKLQSNINLYAKWDVKMLDVTFYVGEEVYELQQVPYKGKITQVTDPVKEGYSFKGWRTSTASYEYDFETSIYKDTDLYAIFNPIPFVVKYDLGYSLYPNKDALYVDFFTDFYNFMKENTDADFEKYNIASAEEFLVFCRDWNANKKDSFYGVGDAFAKYFVTIEVGGVIENQPTSTFIGYCYQNEMYLDFIPHLMTFFAYWRTDEGYTGGSADPNNTGNDFFASAWASLVDTCKFFHFTSENLNDTYSWFNSERVKDALDNIPGVLTSNLESLGDTDNPVILKDISRNGYTFLGWFDSLEEDANKLTEVTKGMTVYAKWQKNE